MDRTSGPLSIMALMMMSLPGLAQTAPAPPDPKVALSQFLAIWSGNGPVRPQAVAALYAPEVVYYGHRRTNREVLSEKQALARRFPSRRYRLLPGSAAEHCTEGATACTVTGVLDWSAGSRAGATRGGATVRLDLVAMDGRWKIVRESGSTIARARCSAAGCSGWRMPALGQRR